MYLIIILHEIGHIVAMKLYKYEIYKITFFPFGAIIECDVNKNRDIKSEIVIYLAGIIVNIALFFISWIFGLPKIIMQLNMVVLLFNLIPVLPLDGGRIFLGIISSFVRFKRALKISYISSILISIALLIISFICFRSLNIMFVIGYFLISNIILYFTINRQYEGFLLGKYLNSNFYLKYKQISLKEIGIENNFFKGKQNIYQTINKKYYERQVLKNKYK